MEAAAGPWPVMGSSALATGTALLPHDAATSRHWGWKCWFPCPYYDPTLASGSAGSFPERLSSLPERVLQGRRHGFIFFPLDTVGWRCDAWSFSITCDYEKAQRTTELLPQSAGRGQLLNDCFHVIINSPQGQLFGLGTLWHQEMHTHLMACLHGQGPLQSPSHPPRASPVINGEVATRPEMTCCHFLKLSSIDTNSGSVHLLNVTCPSHRKSFWKG